MHMVGPYMQRVQEPTAGFADVHDRVTPNSSGFGRREKEFVLFQLPMSVGRKVRTVTGERKQVQQTEKLEKRWILLKLLCAELSEQRRGVLVHVDALAAAAVAAGLA